MTPYIHPTLSFWKNFCKTSCGSDYLAPWLLQLCLCWFACGTNRSTAESSEQCSWALSEETEARPYNTAAESIPLAACEKPLQIQDCNSCAPYKQRLPVTDWMGYDSGLLATVQKATCNWLDGLWFRSASHPTNRLPVTDSVCCVIQVLIAAHQPPCRHWCL